jgi:hypothetical protein
VGDIADDLINAQIMFPDTDPSTAYEAYLHSLIPPDQGGGAGRGDTKRWRAWLRGEGPCPLKTPEPEAKKPKAKKKRRRR